MKRWIFEIQKSKVQLAISLLAAALLFLAASPANAYPVPDLPEDNLIVNPWFRNLSDPRQAGFDGWVRPLNEGVTWGPSQKESNPSPDLVISGTCGFKEVYCGTAARWAEQAGILYPYVDVYAYQVVGADPSHRQLKFFAHYVSHIVEVGEISVYGGESPDGPWQLLWVPLYHSEDVLIVPESRQSVDLWQETGFVETTIERGFPYYKVEMHSRLSESPIPNGIRGVGFKVTGVYFATAFTEEAASGAAAAPDVATPTAEPAPALQPDPTENSVPTQEPESPETAVARNPTTAATEQAAGPAPTASGAEPPASPALSAQALSPTEIRLVWSPGGNSRRGYRLDRSLNMNGGWQPIATLEPGVVEYTDRDLPPDTVLYYRVRVSQDEISNVATVRTLAAQAAVTAAPTPAAQTPAVQTFPPAEPAVTEVAQQPAAQPTMPSSRSPSSEISLPWLILVALVALIAGAALTLILVRRGPAP